MTLPDLLAALIALVLILFGGVWLHRQWRQRKGRGE